MMMMMMMMLNKKLYFLRNWRIKEQIKNISAPRIGTHFGSANADPNVSKPVIFLHHPRTPPYVE